MGLGINGISKLARRSRQPFGQPVPIGDVDREGFLEHCQQSLGNCGVVVVMLQLGDDLALTIDVPLPTLNAAFRFLDVSLQEVRFIGQLTGHRWKAGHFLLDRTSDRSAFPLTKHDSRNSHIETEGGLLRIGQAPRMWTKVGPRPRAPEVLAPVLQLSQCLVAVLSRITYRAMRAEPIKLRRP
jgi:hypothetical protein